MADPPSYESLSADDRRSCDVYVLEAEKFARDREAGVSLSTHLQEVNTECRSHLGSRACTGFGRLAQEVHIGKWTAAEAATRVRTDCVFYSWRDKGYVFPNAQCFPDAPPKID